MIKEIQLKDLDLFLDLVAFVEFDELNINNSTHLSWLNKKLDRLAYCGAIFFGCYDDNNSPIGFATVMIEDRPIEICNGSSCCELIQIGVYDKYRFQGYGSQLLHHVQEYLKDKKVYSLYMHTYAGDYSAISFYGKNDFIPRGTLPDVYGPELEGMLYMSKVL